MCRLHEALGHLASEQGAQTGRCLCNPAGHHARVCHMACALSAGRAAGGTGHMRRAARGTGHTCRAAGGAGHTRRAAGGAAPATGCKRHTTHVTCRGRCRTHSTCRGRRSACNRLRLGGHRREHMRPACVRAPVGVTLASRRCPAALPCLLEVLLCLHVTGLAHPPG